jgi:hypothetical protein
MTFIHELGDENTKWMMNFYYAGGILLDVWFTLYRKDTFLRNVSEILWLYVAISKLLSLWTASRRIMWPFEWNVKFRISDSWIYSSTLKKEALFSSGTSLKFYWTTWRHNQNIELLWPWKHIEWRMWKFEWYDKFWITDSWFTLLPWRWRHYFLRNIDEHL